MHQLNHHHLHRNIVLKTRFHIEDIVVSGIDKHTTEKVDALIRQGIRREFWTDGTAITIYVPYSSCRRTKTGSIR